MQSVRKQPEDRRKKHHLHNSTKMPVLSHLRPGSECAGFPDLPDPDHIPSEYWALCGAFRKRAIHKADSPPGKWSDTLCLPGCTRDSAAADWSGKCAPPPHSPAAGKNAGPPWFPQRSARKRFCPATHRPEKRTFRKSRRQPAEKSAQHRTAAVPGFLKSGYSMRYPFPHTVRMVWQFWGSSPSFRRIFRI